MFDDHTALLVVDVQNDFADPNGSLYVPHGEDVVALINALAKEARAADAVLVYTQDWHPERTPHFEKDGGSWPVHCVQGTWGAELHPDLEIHGPVIRKGTGGEDGYSGFTVRDPESGRETSTGLASLLRSKDVERVIVTGLAQDVCVKETALDALRLGFETIIPADATRPLNVRPGDGARAIAVLVKAGAEIQ